MTNLDHAPTLSLPSTQLSLKTRALSAPSLGPVGAPRLLAGRRGFAPCGLVEVTGRRSGRVYRIPIAIAPYWMTGIRAVLGGVGIQDFLGVRIA